MGIQNGTATLEDSLAVSYKTKFCKFLTKLNRLLSHDTAVTLFGICSKKLKTRDFPGSLVVMTPSFKCRGRGFDPWSGEVGSHMSCGVAKKKEKKLKTYVSQKPAHRCLY